MSKQYSEYDRLPILLKRFSFEEKMNIATRYSSSVILFGKDIQDSDMQMPVLPWCLETFIMLAMEAEEYGDGSFIGKNEKKFVDMCNGIWEASAIVTQVSRGQFDFTDILLAVTGLSQFQFQESRRIRQYRYWKIFKDNSAPVHLETLFVQWTGTSYDDFLLLGSILQILFIVQSKHENTIIPQNVFQYLLNKRFAEAAKHLKVTRSEYVKLQQKFCRGSKDPKQYVYSLCPSQQYAFVEEREVIYFPLPHLFNQCVTSSLLYRLTENDNDLRNKIGKHLWEKYLFGLIEGSGVYQEVFAEQKYNYCGCKSSSPDVLARQGNNVLFIDSKSTVPSLGIRLFDLKCYEENIKIVADNIRKLYNQIYRFERYNPFSGNVSIDKNEHWGIVIVLEDAYIRRIHYFERARKLLEEKEKTVDWEWMISHIKVISLYEIERLCLGGNSIIDACREAFKDDPFSFTFAGYPNNGSDLINKDYCDFKETIDGKILDIINEMKTKGIIE